jgi:hypothetical protein
MSLDQWISIFSASLSLVGLLFVAWQLRDGIQQRESESLVKILDVSRELITLGFSHPQLFAILADEKADATLQKHYLQLWFNHFALIYSYIQRSVLRDELRENLQRDLNDMLRMRNMRQHWQEYGTFYPDSFKRYVNGIMERLGPLEVAQVSPFKSGS